MHKASMIDSKQAKIACFQCGECCRTLKEVIITQEEYAILKQYGTPKIKKAGGGKLKMKLPCVFLKKNVCSIYEVRPCQCRMWHCGRIKLEDKKLEWVGDIQALMAINSEYKEFKIKMEDEAVKWGNAHGWNWRK